MKSKLSLLLIVSFVLLIFTSCANSNTVNPDDQANAYFTVFQKLYQESSGLNDGKYIAVDLTNVKLTDTSKFIELMQGFCKSHKYTLLQDTYEKLKEKGYINISNNSYFKEGFLITFKDKELTQKKLITSATKWRSELGAKHADYTVEKKSSIWQITKTENSTIS